MAETAQAIVRERSSLRAGDPERARDVCPRPRGERVLPSVFRELLTYMMEDPRNIYRAVRAQSIASISSVSAIMRRTSPRCVIFMSSAGRAPPREHGGASNAARHSLSVQDQSARGQMAEALARKLFPPA